MGVLETMREKGYLLGGDPFKKSGEEGTESQGKTGGGYSWRRKMKGGDRFGGGSSADF